MIRIIFKFATARKDGIEQLYRLTAAHRGSLHCDGSYGEDANFNCRAEAEACVAAARELGFEVEIADEPPLTAECAAKVPAIIAEIGPRVTELKEYYDDRPFDLFRIEIDGLVKCRQIKRGTSAWKKAMLAWEAERRALGLPRPTWLDHTENKGHQSRKWKLSASGLRTFRDCVATAALDAAWSGGVIYDGRWDDVRATATEVLEQIIVRDRPTITVTYLAYPGQPPTKAAEIVENIKACDGIVLGCQCSPNDEAERQISASFPDSEAAARCIAALQALGHSAATGKLRPALY